MHGDYDQMTLPQLADHLEDLDGRRTPVGWSPEDAGERATLERLILDLVSKETPPDSSETIRCDLEIKMRSKEQSQRGVVRGLAHGGILIEVDGSWVVGTHVEMQVLQSAADEHGLRARGIVTRIDGRVAKVSVSEQPSEGHERRLRRFVLELIRHRIHN
jgi:hypothetical protein